MKIISIQIVNLYMYVRDNPRESRNHAQDKSG